MGLGGLTLSICLPLFLQYTVLGQVEPPQGQGLRHGTFDPSCFPSGVRAGIPKGGGGVEVQVVGVTLGQGRWPSSLSQSQAGQAVHEEHANSLKWN